MDAGFFALRGAMKTVNLYRGESTQIDDEDLHLLGDLNWLVNAGGYAVANSGGQTIVILHRLITGAPAGVLVDHINGDKLDNRRQNLRLCNHSENMQNRKMHKNNRLGIKGVTETKTRAGTVRFVAEIRVAKQRIWLGKFKTAEDAAIAYQTASKKYHGEFARAT